MPEQKLSDQCLQDDDCSLYYNALQSLFLVHDNVISIRSPFLQLESDNIATKMYEYEKLYGQSSKSLRRSRASMTNLEDNESTKKRPKILNDKTSQNNPKSEFHSNEISIEDQRNIEMNMQVGKNTSQIQSSLQECGSCHGSNNPDFLEGFIVPKIESCTLATRDSVHMINERSKKFVQPQVTQAEKNDVGCCTILDDEDYDFNQISDDDSNDKTNDAHETNYEYSEDFSFDNDQNAKLNENKIIQYDDDDNVDKIDDIEHKIRSERRKNILLSIYRIKRMSSVFQQMLELHKMLATEIQDCIVG